jgi:hypothetical protein
MHHGSGLILKSCHMLITYFQGHVSLGVLVLSMAGCIKMRKS